VEEVRLKQLWFNERTRPEHVLTLVQLVVRWHSALRLIYRGETSRKDEAEAAPERHPYAILYKNYQMVHDPLVRTASTLIV
jgi:hypothetical protein